MYKKVFISYATEDYSYAEELYNFLISAGYSPWMDKKNILIGQDWDLMIQQALREANFIVLILSSISVNKRGYIQKEYKIATNYCEEKLDSDIFLIPVKIDSCDAPDKLKRYQWLEYFSTDAFSNIINSIENQRAKYLKSELEKQHKVLGLEYEVQTKSIEYGLDCPKQYYEANFPVFKSTQNESLNELNTVFSNLIVNGLIDARKNYFNILMDIEENDPFSEMDSTHYTNIEFRFISKDFISFTDFTSFYHTGAAHGNYYTESYNYLLNPLRKIELEDLFNITDEILLSLALIVDKKLMEWAKEHEEGDISEDFYIFDGKLEPKRENFINFYLKENSIVFVYNPYHLTAWVFGDQHPEISFSELKSIFPSEKKLLNLIKLITTSS